MFSIVKFIVWTGCAVAFGIWLALGQVGALSPLQRLQTAWAHQVHPDSVPKEHHSVEDRSSLNRLLAKQANHK